MMSNIVNILVLLTAAISIGSCFSVGTPLVRGLSTGSACINAAEKIILTTPRYREWLADCKKQVGQKAEDGETLLSCGFRGPKEFQQSDPNTEPELEWGFHSNWSGRISVEMWLRFNMATETVEEMVGDYETVEFDKSLLGEVRERCAGRRR